MVTVRTFLTKATLIAGLAITATVAAPAVGAAGPLTGLAGLVDTGSSLPFVGVPPNGPPTGIYTGSSLLPCC